MNMKIREMINIGKKAIKIIAFLYFIFLVDMSIISAQPKQDQKIIQKIEQLQKNNKVLEVNKILNRNTSLDRIYAFKTLNKNIQIAIKIKDYEALAYTYLSIGNFWFLQGNYIKAFENYRESETLGRKYKIYNVIGLSLMNSSNVSQNIDSRIKLLQQAMPYLEEGKDSVNLAKACLNLGNSYSSFVLGASVLSSTSFYETKSQTPITKENAKLYKDSAFLFYQKAKLLNESMNHPELSASISLRKAQWLRFDAKYEEAEKEYKLSSSYFNKAGVKKGVVYCLLELSDLKKSINKNSEALITADSAYLLSEMYAYQDYLTSASKLLAELYELDNNPSKALYYYKIFNRNSLELNALSVSQKIEAINLENTIKGQETLIKVMMQKKKINNLIFLAVFILLFLLAIITIIVLKNRKRKIRDLGKLIEKNKKLNEIEVKLLNTHVENERLQSELLEEKVNSRSESLVLFANQIKKMENHYEKLSEEIKTLSQKIPFESRDRELIPLKFSFMQISNEHKNLVEIAAFSQQINQDFFFYIEQNFLSLTKEDKKLLSMLIINLDSKQISENLNISTESVYKKRYRLRKKLGISNDLSFADFYKDIISKLTFQK